MKDLTIRSVITLLDVPRVQALLLAAFDLLEAVELADPALVSDEIAEKAEAFRAVIEEPTCAP